MPESMMTAREFNQHVSRAKRAANDGPVIITERGQPAYVLLRHEEYEAAKPKLTARPRNALDALTDPNASDFDVDFPRMELNFRSIDPV